MLRILFILCVLTPVSRRWFVRLLLTLGAALIQRLNLSRVPVSVRSWPLILVRNPFLGVVAMHRFIAVAGCCFFAVAGLSFAGVEPEFPYQAVVSSDQLYVRSGPGQEYYPTGRLRRGQEVEVFRHEPTGWARFARPRAVSRGFRAAL